MQGDFNAIVSLAYSRGSQNDNKPFHRLFVLFGFIVYFLAVLIGSGFLACAVTA